MSENTCRTLGSNIDMRDASFDRVGDILARTEETFAEIVERADKYERATVEGARLVEEWARTIIEQDNQYASLFVTTADEINGKLYRPLLLRREAFQPTRISKTKT